MKCIKISVLFVIIVCSSCSRVIRPKHHGFYNATITYEDGTTNQGLAELFYWNTPFVYFKENANASEFKIATSLLKEVAFDTLVFHKHNFVQNATKKEIKIHEDVIWAAQNYASDAIEGYISFFDDGVYTRRQSVTYSARLAFIKIPNNDYIVSICQLDKFGSDPFGVYHKNMRKGMQRYLKDYCPEFIESVDEDDYKTHRFYELLDEYTEKCN